MGQGTTPEVNVDDGELLLRAVLNKPEEDTPRLMYADWLQEQGEHDHAEFVRVQVDLANFPRCPRGHFDNEFHGGQCLKCQHATGPLRAREESLLNSMQE